MKAACLKASPLHTMHEQDNISPNILVKAKAFFTSPLPIEGEKVFRFTYPPGEAKAVLYFIGPLVKAKRFCT
jgi:hypothetical protein